MLWLFLALTCAIAPNSQVGAELSKTKFLPPSKFQDADIAQLIGEEMNQWQIVERANPAESVKLSFRFGVNAESLAALEHQLWAVSTPGNSHYGKFATTNELRELTQATPQSVQAVTDHLLKSMQISEKTLSEISKWSPLGDALYLNLPISDVEKVLGTECYLFVHRNSLLLANSESGISTVRTQELQYSRASVKVTREAYKSSVTSAGLRFAVKTVASPNFVPEGLRNHITSIGGVNRFPQVNSASPRSAPFRIHSFLPQSQSQLKESSVAQPQQPSSVFEFYKPVLVDLHNKLMDDVDAFAMAPTRPSPREVEGYAGDSMVQLVLQPYCPDGSQPTEGNNMLFCGVYGLNAITVSYTKSGSPVTSQIPATGLQIEFTIDNYIPYTCTITTTWTASNGGVQYRTVSTLNDLIGSRMNSPAFIHNWYTFPDGRVATNTSTIQGVVGLDLKPQSQGCFSTDDAQSFYSYFGINNNVDVVTTHGWVSTTCPPDSETQLDIQWITGLAPQANTQLWHDETQQQGADFAEIFDDIIATQNRPSVLSISYGALEDGYVAADDMSSKFIQLGILGVSVIVASGDSGPYYSSDGTGCEKGFRPTFPASNPYVTSVGATMLAITSNSSGNIIEIVCSTDHGALITSGGGFSQYWSRPPYQNATLQRYLNPANGCQLPPSVFFDATKRAYPDVSLLGHSYIVMTAGQEGLMDGTSASAPAFASFISMYNDARLSRGLPVLGFLNPLLYKIAEENPAAFFDVTEGTTSCMTRDFCCAQGFTACRGFDATTGLGTPRFDQLGLLLVPGGIGGSSAPPCFTSDCDVPNHTSMSQFELILIIGSSVVGGLVVCSVAWKLCKFCCCKPRDSKKTMSVNDNRFSSSQNFARMQQNISQPVRTNQLEALLSEQEQLNIAIAESLAGHPDPTISPEPLLKTAPVTIRLSGQPDPKLISVDPAPKKEQKSQPQNPPRSQSQDSMTRTKQTKPTKSKPVQETKRTPSKGKPVEESKRTKYQPINE